MNKQIKTLLLIDDDEITNLFNRIIFKESNIAKKITVYDNAIGAIEMIKLKIQKKDTLPELIFLDINMPIMNGWDFLDQISFLPHSVRDSIKIVMLSASANPDDIARSNRYHFVKGYACKPINADKIKTIFQNLEI